MTLAFSWRVPLIVSALFSLLLAFYVGLRVGHRWAQLPKVEPVEPVKPEHQPEPDNQEDEPPPVPMFYKHNNPACGWVYAERNTDLTVYPVPWHIDHCLTDLRAVTQTRLIELKRKELE